MKKYTVYLKNGVKVSFKCENFYVTYSNLNDRVLDYTLEKPVIPYPVFIKSDEIVMVVKEEEDE